MQGSFHCKKCGAAVSSQIEVQSLKDPKVAAPAMTDGEPICAAGKGYKSEEPTERSFTPGHPAKLEFTPQFWLNPDDLKPFTRLTRDPAKLNGCCGLDGCDGPNLLCGNCGAEVATLRTDCWTPRIAIPDKSNTEFKRDDK